MVSREKRLWRTVFFQTTLFCMWKKKNATHFSDHRGRVQAAGAGFAPGGGPPGGVLGVFSRDACGY
jgi:hypothetical protein